MKWSSRETKDREWKIAKQYLQTEVGAFAESGTKLKRGTYLDKENQSMVYLTHSFIVFDRLIMAMGKHDDYIQYLDDPSKAKIKLGSDERGKLYAIKIERSNASYLEETVAENTTASDLGVGIPGAIRPITENLWKCYSPYFYFRRGTLSDYLHEHKDTMSVDETYQLAIRMAILVHHLHRGVLSSTKKQYAHLDIKPKNIAIPHSEKLCFIDVRFSATLKGPFNKIRGTEGFLPIDALSYKKKTIDIFALLRVLYLAKRCLVQNLYSKGSPIILDERCSDDTWIFHDLTVRKTPRLKALLAKTSNKEQLMQLTTLDIIKELTLARCGLDDSYQPYIGTSIAILLANRLFSAQIPIKKEYLAQDVITTLFSWETLDEERIQTFILSRPSPMALEIAPKEVEIADSVWDGEVSEQAVKKIKPYLNNALFFKQTEDHRRNSMPCMKADFRPLL